MKIIKRNYRTLGALTMLGMVAGVYGALISETRLAKESDRFSYGMGLQIGKRLAALDIDINTAIFMRGLNDARSGREPLLTAEQIRQSVIMSMTKTMPQRTEGQTRSTVNKGSNNPEMVLPETMIWFSDGTPKRLKY